MSPRAAWQLEVLGFTDVYDYVEGKIDWMVNGLPLEGTGPHYPLAAEAATEGVHTCLVGSSVGEAATSMAEGNGSFCLVVNESNILLGRLRQKNLDQGSSAAVESVMETGPTTVRPTEPAKPLLERMEQRKVPAIIVTTKKGELVGVATREKLRSLVQGN